MKSLSISRLNWWQLALLSAAVSLIGSLSGKKSKKEERKVYDKELKQAPWAPPGWVFGPAWMVNNFFLLRALQRLLSADTMPEKKKLLMLQGLIWTIFFSFSFVYFRKKSPVLVAVWTISDAALAVASFLLARKSDKKISYQYLPLILWTGFASTLGNYQALKNPDPVLKTAAPL